MVKTREEVIGYFPDEEPIWVITQHLSQKEDVEHGLNRQTTYIKDLDTLIEAFEISPKYKGNPMANVIIFKDLPEDIKANLSQIIDIFGVASTVKVYEIGRDNVIEGSYEFGTLGDLIRQAKGVNRSQTIIEMDPEDKQKQILVSLETDLAVEKSRVEETEKEVKELKFQLEESRNKEKDLQARIDYSIGTQEGEYKKQIDSLTGQVDKLDSELEIERARAYEATEKNNKLSTELTDTKYEVRALESQLGKLTNRLEASRDSYEQLLQELTEYKNEQHQILSSSVGAEKYTSLQRKLTEEEGKVTRLTTNLQDSFVRIKELEIDLDEKDRIVDTMRKGQLTAEVLGRTTILDHYRLKTTDLVYIKIIDNLPYYRLASQFLFEELQERYDNKVNMVIIKQDDGMDRQYFDSMPLYKDFTEVSGEENQYRLHPHTSMMTGLDRYEEEIECLFVIDYIMNNDYLVETQARSTVMTMVRYAEMVRDPELGLRGMPLTLGKESVYDLEYDTTIATRMIKENRHKRVREKVREWADSLNIRTR